ncbi:restriction endonuclease subunit S [Exiguobacterium sp. s155]|uniref:restriction endonuclease subunit S n=1 Tax=Exiguobacterium sp. s155 TaxID=2751286 RepID=UPI001BE9ECEC|nr:restriction endonuclease subunit S [Exiguobacterium sp. s155]
MKGLFEELKNLEMIPLKSLIDKMKNGYSGNQVLEETEYKVSRIETISDGTVNLKKVGFVEKNDKLNEYKLEFGDLLFSNINSLAMVGKTAIFDFEQENLYAGMNLLIIRPKKNIDSKWLYYVINSYYFNQLVKANAKHAINQVSIPTSKIKELPIAYVDYQEQIKIRAYLDAKTSLIDELIKAKENIINKISQQRQSIITEAVTKGLNSNVKMKDSGVEWIGEIPELWEVSKLKNLFILQRGHDLTHEEFNEGEIPVYASNGIMGYHNTITTKGPNVTVGRSGSVGKVNYVETDFWAHNTCIYVKDNKKNNMKYIYYILKSLDMSNLSTQTAVPTLDRKNIQNSNFVYTVDIEEQREIALYLDRKLAQIDTTVNLIDMQLKKLKEYRQALIYEAVTGKIDVREMEID